MKPANWDKAGSLVGEGEHRVRVGLARHYADDNAVGIQFVVEDEDDEFNGYSMFNMFRLETVPGTRLFSDFLTAVGVEMGQDGVELDSCVDKTLCVTVKHRERDGVTYDNVIAFRTAM